MIRLTPVVRTLLIINAVVFVLQSLETRIDVNITGMVSLWPGSSQYFQPYQFFTYMFAHGGFGHILFNMLGLVFLGPLLEQFWGPKKFLTFYLVTGLGAGVLYSGIEFVKNKEIEAVVEDFVYSPTPQKYIEFLNEYVEFRTNERGEPYETLFQSKVYSSSMVLELGDQFEEHPDNELIKKQAVQVVSDKNWIEQNLGSMLGASGAIYGILMAFGLLFPNTEMMLLFIPFPIKAKYLVFGLGAYAIFKGFQQSPDDHTAHFAHLGGMIFAFIMIQIWKKGRDSFY